MGFFPKKLGLRRWRRSSEPTREAAWVRSLSPRQRNLLSLNLRKILESKKALEALPRTPERRGLL